MRVRYPNQLSQPANRNGYLKLSGNRDPWIRFNSISSRRLVKHLVLDAKNLKLEIGGSIADLTSLDYFPNSMVSLSNLRKLKFYSCNKLSANFEVLKMNSLMIDVTCILIKLTGLTAMVACLASNHC